MSSRKDKAGHDLSHSEPPGSAVVERDPLRVLIELAPDGIFLSDRGGRYVEVNEAGCSMLGRSREQILGATAFDFVGPEEVERMRAALTELQASGRHFFEWTLTRPDGTTLAVEVHTRLLDDGQRQSILRDISERKRAEREERQHAEAMARLHDVASAYFDGAGPEAVLAAILEAAVAIAEADAGSLQTLDDETGELELVHQRGLPPEWAEFWRRAPKGRGACGAAHARVERVIVDDVRQSPLFQGKPELDVQLRAGVLAVQSTPLVSRSGTPLGMMSTYCRTCGRPPERVLRLLDPLARQAADILDRRRGEAELRRSEAQMRAFLAATADAVVGVDQEGLIRAWNAGAETIFGYAASEAIAAPLEMLMPRRFRSSHREHVARFAAGGAASRKMDRLVTLGRRKNGEEFPVDATISTFELNGQRILIATLRDASEQKRIEGEQRLLAEVGGALASLNFDEALQNVARLLVDGLAHVAAVFVREEDAGLRRVATAGRDPESVAAADVILNANAQSDLAHPLRRAVESGAPVRWQLDPERYAELAENPEHLRALEIARPRHALVLPLLVAGTSVGALCLAACDRGFTDRDLELARQVARRSALFVQNANLHRAERRATRARDEALAVVAHDLRNPLNSMVLQVRAFRAKRDYTEQRAADLFTAIRREAVRMTRTIQDLLEVSQLDVAPLEVHPSRVAPVELIGEVLRAHQSEASARSLELRSAVASKLPRAWVDKQRTLQVFRNLISNAFDVTSEGSVTVGAERNASEMTFWVRDTGGGIAEADLPHVFDRFWGGWPKRRSGVGLRLAICRRIVEAQRGRLWVESELGVGTTFLFTANVVE